MPRPRGARTRKPGAKKTGPRGWTLTDRERLKARVAELDVRGHNQVQIAASLDVSQATVSVLLGEVREAYEGAYVDCRKAWVMKATAAHLDVIRQAQVEVERLRDRGRRKTVTESGTTAQGGFRKTVASREDGDVAGLLAVVQAGWREIALLHGLKELPAQVFNVQVNNTAPNIFDRLLAAMLAADPSTPAIGCAGDGRAGPLPALGSAPGGLPAA